MTIKYDDDKFTKTEVQIMFVKVRIDYQLMGERIKNKRNEKGISQEKLAETVAYLSRVERGTAQITLKRLAQISNILQVPIEEFITGVTKEEDIYLDKEFKELFSKCSKDKLKLIYNIAKIVSGVKFV